MCSIQYWYRIYLLQYTAGVREESTERCRPVIQLVSPPLRLLLVVLYSLGRYTEGSAALSTSHEDKHLYCYGIDENGIWDMMRMMCDSPNVTLERGGSVQPGGCLCLRKRYPPRGQQKGTEQKRSASGLPPSKVDRPRTLGHATGGSRALADTTAMKDVSFLHGLVW